MALIQDHLHPCPGVNQWKQWLQALGTNGKKQTQGLPPAQMNLEYLFLREKLEELPPPLTWALQHLSHTSNSYLQDIGEEVDGRTDAQTG